jgi:methionyl aminopeptidase
VITVASDAEVGSLRACGRIAARVRDELRDWLQPGVETRDLDALAERRLEELGATPAFKGYRGYPACICVSVNEQVVHGIPGRRKLKAGDLVSVDIGVKYNGFYTDTAVSAGVGALDPDGERLLRVAREALALGIAQVRPGRRVGDVSHAIQARVERDGFTVVREFVGHGIGRAMHEDPQIPNYGVPGRGPAFVEGQALAIEPMVNEGAAPVRILDDGWTAVTADGRRSAHFEHTVLVMDGAAEVLTRSERED